MEYLIGRDKIRNLDSGCYILTNGLGGYSSLNLGCSQSRNDHAFFMGAVVAPTSRVNFISVLEEIVKISGNEISLTAQQHVESCKDKNGHLYINKMKKSHFVSFTYLVEGIEITKNIVLDHGTNTVVVKYEINNFGGQEFEFVVRPHYNFATKGNCIHEIELAVKDNCVSEGDYKIFFSTKMAERFLYKTDSNVIFNKDKCDCRNAVGANFIVHEFYKSIKDADDLEICFSVEGEFKSFDELEEKEGRRVARLVECAEFDSAFGKKLVEASDAYIVKRESTDGLTVIAGYPFFGDWGRDSMFAILGGTIATNRFEETKNILDTFAKYLHKGIMPNMFPDGEQPPLYNTVDASLLYVWAMYEYYEASKDITYIKDNLHHITSIIKHYKEGTDNKIFMDNDYLISAGDEMTQLTWMDIRYEDELPTPRNGKPVEINAFWYNALKINELFCDKLNVENEYIGLSGKVSASFREKFYCGNYLKDIANEDKTGFQIRSNQAWAVSVPFSPVDKVFAKKVLDTIHKHLYTPCGLRTLSYQDNEFKDEYSGSIYKRDMAYHQGTTWMFPLGGYLIGILKINDYSEEAKIRVQNYMDEIHPLLEEGCVGQLAEIYDGLRPAESRGCFAQAWSVTEILRVVKELEKAK